MNQKASFLSFSKFLKKAQAAERKLEPEVMGLNLQSLVKAFGERWGRSLTWARSGLRPEGVTPTWAGPQGWDFLSGRLLALSGRTPPQIPRAA